MRLLTVFALALAAFSANADNEVQQEIRNFCADKWPNNYEMQEHCVSGQVEAAQAIGDYANGDINNLPQAEADILNHCMSKWSEGGKYGFNWEMVKHCFDNQRQARERLNR